MRMWVALALGVMIAAPGRAAWLEARTRHFAVIGNGQPAELEKLATDLEQFDAVVRIFHARTDGADPVSNPLTVYVVPNVAQIERYCRRCGPGIAGFYSGRASGSIAFTPRRSGDGAVTDLKPQAVLFHEYGHHFLLANYARAYPAWFSEGYAEFVATVKRDKGKFVVGGPPLYRAWGLLAGVGLDARNLFDLSAGRKLNGQQRDALYGRGWLLTHYLMFDPVRRAQLGDYLDKLNAGVPSLQAAQSVFGDLAALDRALTAYLRSPTFKGALIPVDRVPVPEVKLRPLSAGEAALIEPRMQSEAGVTRELAKAVLAKATSLAEPYARDAVVQGWLAEMAYDAGDDAAAERYAAAALALAPDQPQALIYQGRARLRALRRTGGDAKAWTEARRSIIRANRLAPDNAEPLMLFYQSFVMQGAAPPPIAVKGLLRAQELVPQDPGLRMLAVGQLVRDGDLPLATRLLRPLAYDPHLPPDSPAAKLLAVLDAKQVDAAKQLVGGPRDDEDDTPPP